MRSPYRFDHSYIETYRPRQRERVLVEVLDGLVAALLLAGAFAAAVLLT